MADVRKTDDRNDVSSILSDNPDPISGLTEKEVDLLQTSWEIVRQDYRKHAVTLFEMLYEANPTLISRMPAFNNVPVDEIASHPFALAHAVTTLSSLDNLVINACDGKLLAALLVKFGRDHIKRKVYKKDFADMPTGMSLFIEAAIGSHWNEAVEKAWKKFLQHIVDGSFDFLD